MVYGSDTFVVSGGLDLSFNVILPEGLVNSARFDQLMEQYAPSIAGEARDFWVSAAGRRLSSSRQRYQDAIQLEDADGSGFSISLNDPLAVSVELGEEAFDMKPGLMGRVVPMNLGKVPFPSREDVTFRKVTPGSDWIRKARPGKHILDSVTDEIMEVIIPKYIQKIIEEM